MKEEAVLKIVNDINDALWDLKHNECNVNTKENSWETYYGLDSELIKYIRKIEKDNEKLNNIINELERYIKDELILDFYNDDMPCELIVNKMLKQIKELKGE